MLQECYNMDNKTEIKKTTKGVYFLEIPSNFLRITKIKEGDQVEFIMGNSVSIKKDDLVLRKVP
jgi:uncharacterized membrane protein (UPF0127 family)